MDDDLATPEWLELLWTLRFRLHLESSVFSAVVV